MQILIWMLSKTLEAIDWFYQCWELRRKTLTVSILVAIALSVYLVGPWWSLLIAAVMVGWFGLAIAWAFCVIASDDPYDVWRD